MNFIRKDISCLRKEDVPSMFHEHGIDSGYRRPRLSLFQYITSAFFLTNDTLNFWTHFAGFCLLFRHLLEKLSDWNFVRDTYNWPFIAYLFTNTTWPIVSCFAHLLSVFSENARHICFFVDYASLSWHSFGVSVVYYSYAYHEHFFQSQYHYRWKEWYLLICAGASWFCVFAACSTRFIGNKRRLRKGLRVAAFAFPYCIVSFPMFHRLFHCDLDSQCDQVSILLHRRQFLWSFIGIILYGLHYPEVLSPGTFDIFFHSHQIFHICGVLASHDQLNACEIDRILLKDLVAAEKSSHGILLLGMTLGVFAVNVGIVILFVHLMFSGIVEVSPSVEVCSDVVEDIIQTASYRSQTTLRLVSKRPFPEIEDDMDRHLTEETQDEQTVTECSGSFYEQRTSFDSSLHFEKTQESLPGVQEDPEWHATAEGTEEVDRNPGLIFRGQLLPQNGTLVQG